MRKLLLLAVCVCFSVFAPVLHAEEVKDTVGVAKDSVRVSLLTCSPGTEIYQYYGHTALLVRDSRLGCDIVFNYGLFDFKAPFFLWRFLLGHTDYMCGACSLEDFVRAYSQRGTGIREDVLDLTPEESSRLYGALKENCLPENAVYRYNFFYDNCATRVRDQIEKCLNGKLKYSLPVREVSLRDIVHEYSKEYKWSEFGQDLLLGMEADKPAKREFQEFAPMLLEEDLRTSVVEDSQGNVRPLVSQSRMMIPDERVVKQAGFPVSPLLSCLILLLVFVLVSVWDVYRKRPTWVFDAVVMLVHGLAGLLVAFMFFFSAHPTVGSNWQILLLNPLPLVFLYWVIRKERKNERSLYHAVGRIYFFLFICLTYIIPQYISSEVLILALCLLVRSMSNHIIYTYRLRK